MNHPRLAASSLYDIDENFPLHALVDDARRTLEAIGEGAVLRVRPKAMTVAIIIAGLVPVMMGTGTRARK